MELLRGIHNIKASHQGCVLSIGNFDGVHLGHQAVLSASAVAVFVMLWHLARCSKQR